MRIRKRFLSLFAAVTAPPSSDPHGGDHKHKQQPPPLLLVQQQVHPNGNLRVLYDHSTQIGLQTTTPVSTGAGSEANELIVSPHKELESEKKETIKTNDTGSSSSLVSRKESTSRVNTPSLPPPPTTSQLVLKGWLEKDSLIPIKKRRGSFGKAANYHENIKDDDEVIKGRNDASKEVCTKNKKNRKRGNVIMEGSRCSRVNGRGWRCCEKTLVGYSLCEHHLGKGRIKSMNSVRGRAQKLVALKEEDNKEVETNSMDHPDFESDKDWEEESLSSMKGKNNFTRKKKLGFVKARSLSSLLSQIGS